jgi:gluconate kinase
MSKEIIFLFGEMGGGKNYWGEKIAKEKGYTFLDGDTLALPEMAEKVSQFKPLNRELIEKFVDNMAIEIIEKMDGIDGLVVAQALYMGEDRAFLRLLLGGLGYKVRFVWVKTPFFQNMKQIFSRPKGFRWVLYWLMNKPFFQKPDATCETMP